MPSGLASIIRGRPKRLNGKLGPYQEILWIIRGSDVQCRSRLRLFNRNRESIDTDSMRSKRQELHQKTGFLPFDGRTDLIIQAGRLKLIPM